MSVEREIARNPEGYKEACIKRAKEFDTSVIPGEYQKIYSSYINPGAYIANLKSSS